MKRKAVGEHDELPGWDVGAMSVYGQKVSEEKMSDNIHGPAPMEHLTNAVKEAYARLVREVMVTDAEIARLRCERRRLLNEINGMDSRLKEAMQGAEEVTERRSV